MDFYLSNVRALNWDGSEQSFRRFRKEVSSMLRIEDDGTLRIEVLACPTSRQHRVIRVPKHHWLINAADYLSVMSNDRFKVTYFPYKE